MHDGEVQEKIRRLVEQLASGTEKGRIVWTDTGDADAFRANMQGGMVRIQKQLDLDEENHEVVGYSLTLLDRKARELEDYCPFAISQQNDLVNLWNLARRSARSTVDVLDKLLKETASEASGAPG